MLRYFLLQCICFFNLFGYSFNITQLAADKEWRRLLYYDDNNISEIKSPDFFLSPLGRSNPVDELKALIRAYNKPFSKNPDSHPRCRFPARYYWLHKKLDLENYSIVPRQCKKLRTSLSKGHIDSISLMFATGYLGNPASSFGHSFVKLNNRSFASTDLFDYSINYGAIIPKNENIFLYMYRGLFGKYKARMLDKYFYTQDLVYINTEQRDIWEYELDIPKENLLLFRLHLWEILGKDFKYLFLNRNCGYEIARLLEVALQRDIAISGKYWYAPIETFYRIDTLSRKKRLIRRIIYHPSAQKRLFEAYNSLSWNERNGVKSLIKCSNSSHFDDKLASLTKIEQIHVLDFLIQYYTFMMIKDRKNSRRYKKRKYKLLAKRFSLPPKEKRRVSIRKIMPPTMNAKPSKIYLLFGRSNARNELLVGYSPYSFLSTGKNNLEGDELTLLDLQLRYKNESVDLNKLDIIRIKKFNRYAIDDITQSFSPAWQLEVSILHPHNDWQLHFRGAVGKSFALNDSVLIYSLLQGSYLTNTNTNLKGGIVAGGRIDAGEMKLLIEIGKDFLNTNDFTVHAEMSYFLSTDLSIVVDYDRNSEKERVYNCGLRYSFY